MIGPTIILVSVFLLVILTFVGMVVSSEPHMAYVSTTIDVLFQLCLCGVFCGIVISIMKAVQLVVKAIP